MSQKDNNSAWWSQADVKKKDKPLIKNNKNGFNIFLEDRMMCFGCTIGVKKVKQNKII